MNLKNLTFKGGTPIKSRKELTRDKAIEVARDPKKVYIPLHQHVGAGAKALVKKGDVVKVGQKIGETDASLTSTIHSSVSGTVEKIENIYTPDGWKVECVVIESDGQNLLDESITGERDLDSLSKEEILAIVKEAGIVGMGGASFPAHAKMITALDSKVDTLVINGAECEPYLTTDHRVMLEKTDSLIYGVKVLMKYLDAEIAYIGIEDDKLDAVEKLEKALEGEDKIKVAVLKAKFPQGDSYRMIDSVTGRKVPQGGRCKDTASMVSNVGTVVAIAEAVKYKKPLYERVITVTGDGVKEPKNLLAKVGTTIGELLEQCGGFTGEPGKIIVGGPMTGYTQYSLDTPVIKGTTGIVVLKEESVKREKVSPCIKCAKCLEVCPVHLEPLLISANSLKDRFDVAQALNAEACINCGGCSYICPAKRPLTESIAHAQKEIKAKVS